jgi:hypothetical protein
VLWFSKKRGIGLWLGVCLALPVLGASPDMLPEGPEKPWVTQYCARCHETGWIGQAGGTEDGWAARIRRMVRRGAVIPPERIAPLARYLAAALPARVRAEQLASSPVNVTVSPVEVRPLQVWVRTSGRQDPVTGNIAARVPSQQAGLLKAGQRVRAFQLQSRASMFQGHVVRSSGNTISIQLRSSGEAEAPYLLEIIADLGPHLSIPNEAVIEEGDRQLVYVRHASGDLVPRSIRTGQRGELFVEIAEGLKVGEEVVTFGSFFIDAEFRMKGLAGL